MGDIDLRSCLEVVCRWERSTENKSGMAPQWLMLQKMLRLKPQRSCLKHLEREQML